MKRICFMSVLAEEHRKELEDLLFFNPGQTRYRSAILRSIDLYGPPQIMAQGRHIRVGLGRFPDAQNLHALDIGGLCPRLVGTVIHLRERIDRLVIAHIVVAPRHAMAAGPNGVPLAMRMLAQIVEIARCVRGVETVEVLYSHTKSIHIPVPTSSQPACVEALGLARAGYGFS